MICQEIKPSKFLEPYIKSYIIIEDRIGRLKNQRMFIYPSGHLELILSYGDEVNFDTADRLRLSPGNGYLGGQISGPVGYVCTGRLKVFSVIFRPWGAYRILNIPQKEFTDRRIDLELILGEDVSVLTEKLVGTAGLKDKIRLVEAYLLRRFLKTEMPSVIPRIARTAAVIENTLGKTDLADVAAKLSIAVKTMERDFHRGIGLSPKEFARIIRFNKVLNSLNSGPRMNIHDLVYQCGYYDQSHLINEFREFTGTTPSALVRRDPASEEPEGGVHQSFRERVRI